MANEKKNYYDVLGVPKNASESDIKSAYRKLAKQYHPDLHPGDAVAAEKFKEINEANETLSDSQKRAAYDYELEHPGMGGMGGGFGGFGGGGGFDGFGDIGDIFSSFFGGGFGGNARRTQQSAVGEDIQKEMTLSFMDAAKGCQKSFTYTRNETCSSCHGTGAKNGTAYQNCARCKGTGVVQTVQNTMFGRTIRQGVCPDCGGTGKIITDKCLDCKGKGVLRSDTTVNLTIPAGVDKESYMRKRGFGNAVQNGSAGDLIITFRIEPHKIFVRNGFDLHVELPVSFKTATLGGTVKVPTLDDTFEFTVPEGTQTGQIFTLRGKGIRSSRGDTGNLVLKILVEVPTHLTKDQKKAVEEMDGSFDYRQCEKMKKYADGVEALYGEKPYKK